MNFAPLGAMALFGSAYLGKNHIGLVVTMLAWFISDFVLNNFVYSFGTGITFFTNGFAFIYGSIVLIYLVGIKLFNNISFGRVVGGSLAASVIFFVLSNLGVWASGTMYPMTLEGLQMCYAAAIPFFQNTLAGDLVYSGVLFVGYEYLFRRQLEESTLGS